MPYSLVETSLKHEPAGNRCMLPRAVLGLAYKRISTICASRLAHDYRTIAKGGRHVEYNDPFFGHGGRGRKTRHMTCTSLD